MIRKVFLALFGIALLVYGTVWAQSIFILDADSSTSPPLMNPNVDDVGLVAILPENTPESSQSRISIAEAVMNEDEKTSIEPGLTDQTNEVVLFDFDAEDPSWYTVNDDVMGGISTSFVTVNDKNQRLTFSGNLSLENNGGFASTRSQWTTYELEDYDGIRLHVLGDGRIYQLRIRSEQTGSEIAYAASFATEENIWQEIYIPFAEMIPLYRGFIVNDAGPLNPAFIRSFGLMLADKQQGEFLLEVDQISAVSKR